MLVDIMCEGFMCTFMCELCECICVWILLRIIFIEYIYIYEYIYIRGYISVKGPHGWDMELSEQTLLVLLVSVRV